MARTEAQLTSSEIAIVESLEPIWTANQQIRVNSWATSLEYFTPSASGDVTKVGTPINNQVWVWTGDGTLEWDSALTFDTTTDTLATTLITATTVTTTGGIELWHASDTTISRVSAGKIAVEGVNVPTVSSTDTLTNKDLSSSTNKRPIQYVACSLNGTTALTTSDKAYFRIPSAFTGMNLVTVQATVGTGASGSSSSGIPTFTVKNVTDGNQMLSTNLTVDASEYTSATAATAAVINTSFDDVVTDDLIEVACTVAGTGVTYATITLWFQLP